MLALFGLAPRCCACIELPLAWPLEWLVLQQLRSGDMNVSVIWKLNPAFAPAPTGHSYFVR